MSRRVRKRDAKHEERMIRSDPRTNPEMLRFVELYEATTFDASTEMQQAVFDALDRVPIEVRRDAFALPADQDPLSGLVDEIARYSRRGGTPKNREKDWKCGPRHSPIAYHVIAWIYGVTKQRVEQLEFIGRMKMSRDRELRRIHEGES